jgi:DNA polymerase I-like protein with 3'-5' exonuclease and polymerase domains
VESYGKSECNRHGRTLPEQTQFHPVTCQAVDKVRPEDLILTCAITLIEDRKPTDTMVLEMDRVTHVGCLIRWLEHCDELWGMNLLYDLVMLRTIPAVRAALAKQHRIIDLGVRNYQHSELRPERSLKNIGPILGLWTYEQEIQKKRFKRGEWKKLIHYNAEDTHNTILGIVELEDRIARDYQQKTAKLSTWSDKFYSDLCWSVVHIAEAGVAFSREKLWELGEHCRLKIERCYNLAEHRGLHLHGEGSNRDKAALVRETVEKHPEVLSENLLKLTPKTKEVSFGGLNRKLIEQKIPATSPYRPHYRLLNIHSKARQLVTHYIKPLEEKYLVDTLHKSKHPMVFPSWHLFPGPFKDGGGKAGGTLQGRITATGPPLQTNPDPIQRCITSRWDDGVILSGDLSQIELRVPAVMCGEPALVLNYRTGGDLHSKRAAEVFGADVVHNPYFHSGDNERDPRQWAKQFNFADQYRAGPKKLRELLLDEVGRLFSWDLCRRVVNDRPKLRPVLWAWQEELLKTARRDGYLHLPFTGQSRYLDPDDDHNAILNFPIQTTAGNVLHRLKHYVVPRLPGRCLLFGDIYDALVFDVPRDSVGEVTELVYEGVKWLVECDYWGMLQEHYGNEVPLKAEVKTL